MSALMHPVGPRSPRVYWVRRLIVLIALGALVGMLLVLVNGVLSSRSANGASGQTPAAGADGAADDASGESSAPAQDEASGTPEACTPAQLTLALTADARTYAAGATPVFTVTLTNVSDVSCTIDAGEASREVLVTSGSDRIWSSLDCPAEPAERMLLLPSGGRDDYAVTWQRVRSAAGCTDGLPAPRPGTYTAVANLAGATSTAAVFELQG